MKKRKIIPIITATFMAASLLITNTSFADGLDCDLHKNRITDTNNTNYSGNGGYTNGLYYAKVEPSNPVYNQILATIPQDEHVRCDTSAPIWAVRTPAGYYTAISNNSHPTEIDVSDGRNWQGGSVPDEFREYLKNKEEILSHQVNIGAMTVSQFNSEVSSLKAMNPDNGVSGKNVVGLEKLCKLVCDECKCKDKDCKRTPPPETIPRQYFLDYPEYKHDRASRSDVAQKDMPMSWTMFDNSAKGTDGYPLNIQYSAEDAPSDGHIEKDVVITPFGEMMNKLRQGIGDYAKFKNPAPSVEATNAYQQELIQRAIEHKNRTDKTKTGITIPKDHAISKALAKGGIVRVQKMGKREYPSYPSAWKSFFHRNYERHNYKLCNDQKNGREVTAWDKKGKPTRWINCSSLPVKEGYTPWKLISGWIPGVSGKGPFTGNYFSQKSNMQVGSAEWASGCWSETKHLAIVKFPYQCFMHILHYYILNILCNKNDYEHYRAHYKEWGWNGDFKESKQDSSDRFQASMNSPIFRKIEASDGGMSGPVFPRMARELAKHGELPGWDSGRVEKMYFDYNGAKNDPVYTKECPFDCVNQGTSNPEISRNIGNNKNAVPFTGGPLNRSGVAETPTTAKGRLAKITKNKADMVFFRNNYWDLFRTDIFTPQNEQSITYEGKKAKRTVIIRNNDPTPWKPGITARIQGSESKSGGYKDVLSADMPSNGNLGYQKSPDDATPGWYGSSSITPGAVTAIMNGQLNYFRIRAPWASEPARPIRLSIRWEYDTKNNATIVRHFEGVGDHGKLPELTTKQTISDGKCDATFKGGYVDTTEKNYRNTGAGYDDHVDDRVDDSDNYARALKIHFVRASAE